MDQNKRGITFIDPINSIRGVIKENIKILDQFDKKIHKLKVQWLECNMLLKLGTKSKSIGMKLNKFKVKSLIGSQNKYFQSRGMKFKMWQYEGIILKANGVRLKEKIKSRPKSTKIAQLEKSTTKLKI